VVRLTKAGVAKLEEVRGPYYKLLSRVFRDTDGPDLHGFVDYLDEIRSRLSVPGREAVGESPRR
jgi:hypothetical protein